MPRVAKVSRERAVEVLKSFIIHFQDPDRYKWPPYTSDVYKQMSKATNGDWTHHNWYTVMREDRRNINSEVRKLFFLPDLLPINKTAKSSTDIDSASEHSCIYEDNNDVDYTTKKASKRKARKTVDAKETLNKRKRKSNQGFTDEEQALNNEIYDAQAMICDIENLSLEQSYIGSIQEISCLPFKVIYSTPKQLETYKEFCTMNSDSIEISIDATGSLIKKLRWKNSLVSDHVFLYSMVVKFEDSSKSVYQLLTECQTSETFEYWLSLWKRFKAPMPRTVVVSYMRALWCACSMSFNRISLKTFMENSFTRAILQDDNIPLPRTFIRIGMSQLIKKVCSWTCLQHLQHKQVQDFYVRCVILLAECQSIDEFRRISVLVCAIAANPFHDSIVQLNSKVMVVNGARKELEQLISKKQERDEIFYTSVEEVLKSSVNIIEPIETEEETGPDNVEEFIASIFFEAKKEPITVGDEYSPFYYDKVVDELEKLLRDFPLWSSAVLPHVAGRATSYNHQVFDDIQNRVLGGFTKPVHAEELVRFHIGDLLDGNLVSSSEKSHFSTSQEESESKPLNSGKLNLFSVNLTGNGSQRNLENEENMDQCTVDNTAVVEVVLEQIENNGLEEYKEDLDSVSNFFSSTEKA